MVGILSKVAVIDSILAQERADHTANLVVTYLAKEARRHTCAAKRYHRVECGSTRNGGYCLVVLEKDVENGFSYTYHSTHKSYFLEGDAVY